jgi:hypothetical protein
LICPIAADDISAKPKVNEMTVLRFMVCIVLVK